MQRKKYAGVLTAVLSVLVAVGLTSCGGTKEELNVTNLQIDEAGVVTHTMIEDFDVSLYNVAELEDMIQEEIVNFGNEFQSGTVSLVSAAVSETQANKVTVVMQFSDAAAYSDFNDVSLFFGTAAEAGEQGYELENLVFADASDKVKTAMFSEIAETAGHILIMNENIPVKLPYKILYTSGDAELLDKYTVSGSGQSEDIAAGQSNGWIYVITK